MLRRGNAPPIFFGLAKENGLCTVQKKNAFRSKFTSHGTWDVNLGMRASSRCVWQKLAGSHPAALYAGVRQDVYAAFGTLGADLWVVVARASAPGPADAMPAFEHPRFGRMLSAPTGMAGGTPGAKCCTSNPVGRDDPGPLGGKFSANFPAYKNFCRGGYQPPGFCRHPRFGRMLSAPTGAAGAKCCTANPAGRGDLGPPGGKFSANFPAYKNLCRGGYQPPGFRRHPRFGRMLSAPAGAAGGAAGAKCCTANPAGRGIWGRGCTLAGNLWRLVPPVLWAP